MAEPDARDAPRVAIIGAGLAGLACAGVLQSCGIEPILFDKGRRPGGRISSLRLDVGGWDFGAPCLRPKDQSFGAEVERWKGAGLVKPWASGPRGAMVGLPGMGTIIEHLCSRFTVTFNAQVQQALRGEDGWRVLAPAGQSGPFAALVVAVPAEQAAGLLSLLDLGMARDAATVRSRAHWSVMLTFDRRISGLPDFIEDCQDFAWISRETSKPGRGPEECWVLHADTAWSARNLEREPADVAQVLLAQFSALAGRALPEPLFIKAHRWRFACPFGQRGREFWNPLLRLGACGDWCSGEGLEGAWLSGQSLGTRIAAELAAPVIARQYA